MFYREKKQPFFDVMLGRETSAEKLKKGNINLKIKESILSNSKNRKRYLKSKSKVIYSVNIADFIELGFIIFCFF